MNITPFQYARALFEATEHASEADAQAIIARFAECLRRDGKTRSLPSIIDAFGALWNGSRGIVEAEVTSRVALDVEGVARIERSIAQRYGAKEVVITNRVDGAIGGGIVVRVGDELLDGSVATQLARLRKHLGAH